MEAELARARLLQESTATECCKLTLEVQENNSRARSIYARFSFRQAGRLRCGRGTWTLALHGQIKPGKSDEQGVPHEQLDPINCLASALKPAAGAEQRNS